MPNRLNVPPELASLIEKREDPDRRQSLPTAREGEPPADVSPADSHAAGGAAEHRTGKDRRQAGKTSEGPPSPDTVEAPDP
jgi:hypothetical protein